MKKVEGERLWNPHLVFNVQANNCYQFIICPNKNLNVIYNLIHTCEKSNLVHSRLTFPKQMDLITKF